MKYVRILFLLVITTLNASAQKQIRVEDFTIQNRFTQKVVSGINWMNDGKYYTTLENNRIVKYDMTTGQVVETLLDGSTLPAALEIDGYSLSTDEEKVLLQTSNKQIYRWSFRADYYVYDFKTKYLRKLSQGGDQSYATFSPSADKVAFVRENNLFYVNLDNMTEVQVTQDGKFNHVINGTTDWVYEEEFSFVVGFFWSPDGNKLAYYRFDESDVKEYNLQKWNKGQLYPEDYRFKYPKAGEANSKVQICVYELSSKKKTTVDTGTETDIYIPRISWTANPNTLSVRKLNRHQNHLEIIHADAMTGKSAIILSEKSETYIDIEILDDLTYLNNGKEFIYSTEADGFKHLYLYGIDGKLIRQITRGNFEVVNFLGLDQQTKTLYYTSTEVSPLEKHLYSISLDGKKKTRLTQQTGTHSVDMAKDFQFYIDQYSSADQPLIATLYRIKGNVSVKILEKNEQLNSVKNEYELAHKEFFSFTLSDGTLLNGYMLKPKNFSAAGKYPLMIYQYSGPGSQNVTNAWEGKHIYFHHMLAQKGFIVAVIDTRGTGSRGEKFKKLTYKQLGKFELEDIVAAGKFLGNLNYVDENRMGIWGWSYGGYMTSLAIPKPQDFSN